jgi:predicted DNA-binding ribbon-helix-helix protein
MSTSRLVNRNVTSTNGRTSMRLEPELWAALEEICHRESMTLADLVKSIERRGHPGGRTSAVRVFVLTYFRNAAGEEGHRAAGHGLLEQLADAPESEWRTAQRTAVQQAPLS